MVPVTLVNADDGEIRQLTRLIALAPRFRGQDPKRIAPQRKAQWEELCALLDEHTPVYDGGRTLLGGKVALELHDGVKRDQRQSQTSYRPWRMLLALRLRQAVAGAIHLHGKKITPKLLSAERRELRRLLDSLIAYGRLALPRPTRATDRIESRLRERLSHNKEVPRVGLDADECLKVFPVPNAGDLGLLNTWCLFELLRQFPVTSLGRCAREACRRYYVPGAEGRKRTSGIRYCADACKRILTNAKRSGG